MIENKPLFVLGNPRSGTSMLRLMLTSHPEICIPPECGFIQWWYTTYKNWSQVDSQDPSKIAQFVSDVLSSKKIETWGLNSEYLQKQIAALEPSSYAELCLLVIKNFANKSGANPQYLGDKNNYYVAHLNLIKELFPYAKFVAIIRDGRDIACSYRAMQNLETTSQYKPDLPTDIKEIANTWALNNKNLLSAFEKMEASQNWWVRYEDLISEPEMELRKICTFLEIEFSEAMLNYHSLNQKLTLEPSSTLDWKKKTLEKPDSSNQKKYLQELSGQEIEQFNMLGSNILNHFGYEH